MWKTDKDSIPSLSLPATTVAMDKQQDVEVHYEKRRSKKAGAEWNDRPEGASSILPVLIDLFHWLDVLTIPGAPNTSAMAIQHHGSTIFSCLL